MSTRHDAPMRTPSPLVLIVAQGQAHRSFVAGIVRTLGFQVRACATASEALTFLRGHPRGPALLLTDLNLPVLDGYALMDRALEVVPGLPVVLMVTLTGPHLDELIDQIPFVAKPVRFGELAGVLYDLLGQPADATSDPPSITRPRRRRASGQHEV